MEMSYTITMIIILCLCASLGLLIVRCLQKYLHGKRDETIDEMDGHDFEYFCAELLEKNGFIGVEVTKGSGEYGIDIIAEKDGLLMPYNVSGIRRLSVLKLYNRLMLEEIIMTKWLGLL